MANFNNLPADIVLDIITRLPAESILECKLVCKPWRDLVSYDPSFPRLHLSHHLNHSSADSGMLSFLLSGHKNDLHYFDYNENNDETCIRRINLTLPFHYPYNSIIGSVNGFFCLYGSYDYGICICNPMTREYVKLPNINGWRYTYSSTGFGYIPSTNEYKVVVIYKLREDPNFIEAAVYTLGSGKGWRKVGRLGSDFCIEYNSKYGIFADRALHWVEKGGRRFLSFDLTEEKLCEQVLPYLSPPGSALGDRSIVVLGGALCCATNGLHLYTGAHNITEVRLLKEKNDVCEMTEQVENMPFGWKKKFRRPGPLAFIKSGGVLSMGFSYLSIYDPVTSTSKKLLDNSAFGEIFPHKNMLVSLKELGEADIKVMESAEIEETAAKDEIPGNSC